MQTRITIVDDLETVSFAGPVYLLKMMAASCSQGARTIHELLTTLGAFDPETSLQLIEQVGASPADKNQDWSNGAEKIPDHSGLVRVIDDNSREKSLSAVDGGLVIFNLSAKRIVQISLSSSLIAREGRGRMRRNGRSVSVYYAYALPADWSIVP